MADLQQYEVEMRGEHTRLTQAYESQQTVADAEWEKLEAAKRALSAFRAKGVHTALMHRMPVHLVCEDRLGLKGAVLRALA
jgi:glucokinase